MDYTRLTNNEALDILRKHDEVSDADFTELERYIEDPVSVLYWTDADGDFEQAVRIQGLPMDTPIEVARGLNDTYYDFLAHEVNTAGVTERTCAGCGSTLYEFEFRVTNYTDRFWIDEDGDHMYDEVEFLDDLAAPPYWQADPDGPMIACRGCHCDGVIGRRSYGSGTSREDTGEYALRGFDGKTGQMTQYSIGGDCGTVVRDDWYWFSMDNRDRESRWTSMDDIFPFDAQEVMRAHGQGRADETAVYGAHDYVTVHPDEVIPEDSWDKPPAVVESRLSSHKAFRRKLTEVLKGWANATEPHPDLKFRYLINKGSVVYVHKDNADAVRRALREQTLSALD